LTASIECPKLNEVAKHAQYLADNLPATRQYVLPLGILLRLGGDPSAHDHGPCRCIRNQRKVRSTFVLNSRQNQLIPESEDLFFYVPNQVQCNVQRMQLFPLYFRSVKSLDFSLELML